jgi:hypothetical protein
MKRKRHVAEAARLWFGCSIVILAAICASPSRARSEELPFRVDPRHLEFGSVVRGQAPEARIRMVNVTDRTIAVRRVEPACDCVGVAIDGPTEVQPSGVLELQVSYDTLRQPAGPAEKTISVYYEDGTRRSFDINVAIDVMPGVMFEPTFLSFGKVRTGETRTLHLLLHTPDETDFAIGSVEVSHPDTIKTSFARQEHSRLQPQHQLDVVLGPLNEPGLFSGSVVLYTQHWSDTELEVPVFAEVVGPFSVEPTTIYRSRVTPGETVEETLKVTSGTVEPNRLHVSAETESLKVLSPKLLPVKDRADRLTLRLSVPDDFSGTVLTGKLILHAGDRTEPMAKLTVFLYLPPAEAKPSPDLKSTDRPQKRTEGGSATKGGTR